MTLPPPPQMYASTMVGVNPNSASDVNYAIGNHLRAFVNIKETIGHDYDSLLGVDLKAAPYNMSADDETLLKSAINGLHQQLETTDMTFINRLTGLW